MNISIKEISDALKDIFKKTQIQNTDSTYEKIDGSENLKLVIFINRMLENNINIFYTKLIFVVNKEKTYLENNGFSYLFDINCEYVNVNFSDIDDMNNKLKNIFTKNKFGSNIKILSEFIEKPSFLINDWLGKNNVTAFSIYGLKYEPKIYIIPCKSLSFTFMIDINNTNEVELTIRKENDGLFIYSFMMNNETITVEKPNLSTLVETIGDVLKNNFK